MVTINKVELPDELMHSIERRAALGNISVEEQVVRDLMLADREEDKPNEAQLLNEIRQERDALAKKGVYLSEEFLTQAKSWGRP